MKIKIIKIHLKLFYSEISKREKPCILQYYVKIPPAFISEKSIEINQPLKTLGVYFAAS